MHLHLHVQFSCFIFSSKQGLKSRIFPTESCSSSGRIVGGARVTGKGNIPTGKVYKISSISFPRYSSYLFTYLSCPISKACTVSERSQLGVLKVQKGRPVHLCCLFLFVRSHTLLYISERVVKILLSDFRSLLKSCLLFLFVNHLCSLSPLKVRY